MNHRGSRAPTTHMWTDVRMFGRFAAGLRGFLATQLSTEDCERILAESLRHRERNFLQLTKRAVFDYPRSPYLPLLRRAGVEFGDLERLVSSNGIEATLIRLRSEGVHVGLDEFKGKRPIQRPGLTLDVTADDFDNPLLSRDFEVESGGSTGPRRRMAVDLDLLVYEAATRHLFLSAHSLLDRPFALWRAIPPGSAAIKHALRAAKLGRPIQRWFSPRQVSWNGSSWKSALFLRCAVWQGERRGGQVPRPEFVPLSDPEPVARWLVSKVSEGHPGLLACPASTAVRAATYCREKRLDVAGTVFWVGGEPLTQSKLRLIQSVGASTINGWALSETGPLAVGCAAPDEIDEVHILAGKIALIEDDKLLADGTARVKALLLTTLLPATPKILINVDSGDHGELGFRRCGCPVEAAGLDRHLHTIRNYEKLTAGGMHFLGNDLLTLVEEVLPAAHGGLSTQYQFVEEEIEAESRVSILVSPQIGDVDAAAVVATVLRFLGSFSRGAKMMAEHWQGSGTLRVVRREPYTTLEGKIPPIRSLGQGIPETVDSPTGGEI